MAEGLIVLSGILIGTVIGMLLLYVTIKAAILSAYDDIKSRESD